MSTTTVGTALDPQLLGRSENLHRAMLTRTLAGTGLDYPGWAALKVASIGTPAPRTQLADRIVTAGRIEAERVEAALDLLLSAGLIEDTGPDLALTPAGTGLADTVSATAAANVGEVYGSIPAEDLATAGRVVTAINAAIEAKLGLA
ncbi:hypothetical protein ACFW1A_39845 [Kitasatospora sp. NPDC058965]|uniref:hypothetical protein n=1 Tax=Kitasatospora sp. NPDC058965 TaxID=3346682 RepID=UPI0036D07695